MEEPKKTESLQEIKRIRIRGLADARSFMKAYGISTLAEFFLVYECKNQEIERREALEHMQKILDAMRGTLREGLLRPNRTSSGMINGGAALMDTFLQEGKSLIGPGFTQVIRNTLAGAENNACMGRIVAAPTAGSSGVLPGSYLTIADARETPDDRIVQGLFVAGGIGECIAIQASLAGASHGCQAENGSASAMAAAAIASLMTEDPDVIESAAAFALKNILGLVCDPIAGLVEIPCVKRNVIASVNAVASAEMALAGIRTVIPFDEVVQVMDHIGKDMPSSLKETSMGGLAATPTAIGITMQVKNGWKKNDPR